MRQLLHAAAEASRLKQIPQKLKTFATRICSNKLSWRDSFSVSRIRLARKRANVRQSKCPTQHVCKRQVIEKSGAGYRTRTYDPLITNHLYMKSTAL